jgi:hypothetical protein
MSTTTAPLNRAEVAHNGGAPTQTAFIAAPPATDTRALRQVLERLGLHALTVFEADLPGRTLSEVVLECIRRSDVVVGVLGDSPPDTNVLYALGVARGLGKRVLIVAADEAQATVAMLGDPSIRSKPDNEGAIEFALTQLLAAPPHGKPTEEVEESATRTQPIDGLADELLALVRGGEKALPEDQIVEVIRRALVAAGVTAAVTGKVDGDRSALAVWADDLEPWVHNPLLVELLPNVRSAADVQLTIRQVREYMARTQVSTALVLCLGATPTAVEEMNASQILLLSVEDFLEALRDAGFGEVIRRLRNRHVPGAN